jgi:hypothetical protein
MDSPPTDRQPHAPRWLLATVGLLVLLAGAYAALPLAWRHYEHRKGLEGRDMVTRTKQGIPGDPINFGVIGSRDDLFRVFHAAGWEPANPVTLASSAKIVSSVALRRPYAAAPVSPLYYDGRPEDLAFEKASGRSADRRHHVRLWQVHAQTALSEDPRPLWLASVSFDKGVGVSHYTLRVTHHIDPDLDAERAFLADALAATGLTTARYEVSGAGPMVIGRNGGGDRYFTDGEVVIETLGAGGVMRSGPAPNALPNPWQVHLKNQIWRALRPFIRALQGQG